MKLSKLAILLPACQVAAQTSRAHEVRDGPKLDSDPNTTKYCSFWYDNDDGSTSCEDIPGFWAITEEQWKRWNPSIAQSCDNFVVGKSYCVEATGEPEPSPLISTSAKTTSTTTTTSTTAAGTSTTTHNDNGIATPIPTMPGMVDNCDKFYKVQDGDTCDKITSTHGISSSEFLMWNTGVGGKACTGLWRDAYVCVSVLGRKPTASKPDNGIATPTPIQPGMVDNCNKFYKVASGDNCAGIASKHNILVKEFVTWNPKIGGESCTGLWLDTFVCVSVIGYKPRPLILTQPSIVQPCSKLHKAVAGDTCQSIVKQYGDLDLATFYRWNPAVKNDCSGLWAGYQYCVGVPSAFSVKAFYHTDCTGKVHVQKTLPSGSGGVCVNTDCQVASLDVSAIGDCPGGQVQVSYWEQPGCQGKWFGYGYTSRGTCRKLWTEGWKFKAVHLRCAAEADDCVNRKTCTYDAEPSRGGCQ